MLQSIQNLGKDGWHDWPASHVWSLWTRYGESFGTREDRDVARMRQARDTIGPGAALFVDADGAYTAKQAVRIMQKVHDLDISWFEEPVSSDNLAGLREVRERVDADVAAGEYGTDPGYYWRMCAADALDCVQADVSRCGGTTGWLRIVALAAACNLEISGHCAPHMTVHAAAATPNFRHLEWFHDVDCGPVSGELLWVRGAAWDGPGRHAGPPHTFHRHQRCK